jgi:hypothetical protein
MIKVRWPKIYITPLPERGVVTFGIFALIIMMFAMAREEPKLWEVELFKTLLTAVVITGFLNMVVAYHFTANKSDETKADNTGKAFEAIKETARAVNKDAGAEVANAADAVAGAAADQAKEIKEGST